MVYFENAKLLNPDDLVEQIDEEIAYNEDAEKRREAGEEVARLNPTIDRLMFIEANNMKGVKNIYPCFLTGYAYDGAEPTPPEVDNRSVIFYFSIVQIPAKHFGLLEVAIKKEEFGVTKRIWDKPPKKSVREAEPWVSQGTGVS